MLELKEKHRDGSQTSESIIGQSFWDTLIHTMRQEMLERKLNKKRKEKNSTKQEATKASVIKKAVQNPREAKAKEAFIKETMVIGELHFKSRG